MEGGSRGLEYLAQGRKIGFLCAWPGLMSFATLSACLANLISMVLVEGCRQGVEMGLLRGTQYYTLGTGSGSVFGYRRVVL